MKKCIILFLFIISIYVGCQTQYSRHPIEKAIIYYNANEAPWGILRIATVDMRDYLRDSANLSTIIIEDRDTLQFIQNRLIHKDTIVEKHNIDAWIVALLYTSEKVDTLVLDAYPENDLQYDNLIFKDSILAYYLIDLIRNHNLVWDKQAMEFYYNGKYNPLPKSFWDTPPHR